MQKYEINSQENHSTCMEQKHEVSQYQQIVQVLCTLIIQNESLKILELLLAY